MKMTILFVPLVYLLVKEILQGEFAWAFFLDVGILVPFLLVGFGEVVAGVFGVRCCIREICSIGISFVIPEGSSI